MALIAVGIALNVIVVLLNAAMPVAISSASTLIANRVGQTALYRIIDPGVLAPSLGDILALGLPSGLVLVSPGDVALMVGACTLIVSTMLNQTQPVEE